MSILFVAPGTVSAITLPTAFQTLADDGSSITASVETTDLKPYRDFILQVGTQGSARAADAQISLLIIPDYTTLSADTGALKIDKNWIAKDRFGHSVTWTMDAATTARDLVWSAVAQPAVDYYVGILNETGQALAGTNALWATAAYTITSS